MSEEKRYFWHGPGVLPYKGGFIKKGKEVPKDAVSKDRLAYFIKIGKISDKEVSDPAGSQDRLLGRIAELEKQIASDAKDPIRKELRKQKAANVLLTEEVKSLNTLLEDVKAKAAKEDKGLLEKLGFGKDK